MEERHNRKYYQDAFENVSPYCSEGMCQLTIDGLRGELETCKSALDDMFRWYDEEKRGAPCHSHYDGLHCTWDMCERPGGWQRNFEECMRWTGLGFSMDGDLGYCNGASWFWDDDSNQMSYDNYLYCKSKPTCKTWSD